MATRCRAAQYTGDSLLGAAWNGAMNGLAVEVSTATFGYVWGGRAAAAQQEAMQSGDTLTQIGFGFGMIGARGAQALAVMATGGLALEGAAALRRRPWWKGRRGARLLCRDDRAGGGRGSALGVAAGVTSAYDSYQALSRGDIANGMSSAFDSALAFGASWDALKSGFSGACFAAGTPLLAADGCKPIEEFQVGDMLVSAPEGDADAPVELRRVQEVFKTVGRILEVRVGGRLIRTTGEHPFYVHGKGWTKAKMLSPADFLRSDDGRLTPVEGIQETGEDVPVYNLRVAEYHTYFVGDPAWGFSVWAHIIHAPLGSR